MNSRSYIRILNNKGSNSNYSNQFTTVNTPTKQQRSTRRRRLKEKKKTQHIQHSTASNGSTFDEASMSAKSVKPIKILHKSPPKPSKKPLPPKRRLVEIETHTSEKQDNRTSNHALSNHSHAKSPPKHTNKHKSPSTQMSFSAQFIAKKRNINGLSSESKKITMDVNHLKKRKYDERSGKINGNQHKCKKINELMIMLDGIDTDDIFNEIVNHKRNYEFPRTASGIYKSFIWDHTIEHDSSSWDMLFKWDQH